MAAPYPDPSYSGGFGGPYYPQDSWHGSSPYSGGFGGTGGWGGYYGYDPRSYYGGWTPTGAWGNYPDPWGSYEGGAGTPTPANPYTGDPGSFPGAKGGGSGGGGSKGGGGGTPPPADDAPPGTPVTKTAPSGGVDAAAMKERMAGLYGNLPHYSALPGMAGGMRLDPRAFKPEQLDPSNAAYNQDYHIASVLQGVGNDPLAASKALRDAGIDPSAVSNYTLPMAYAYDFGKGVPGGNWDKFIGDLEGGAYDKNLPQNMFADRAYGGGAGGGGGAITNAATAKVAADPVLDPDGVPIPGAGGWYPDYSGAGGSGGGNAIAPPWPDSGDWPGYDQPWQAPSTDQYFMNLGQTHFQNEIPTGGPTDLGLQRKPGDPNSYARLSGVRTLTDAYLPGVPQDLAGYRENITNTAFDAAKRQLDPRAQSMRTSFEEEMANRGLPPGSEEYEIRKDAMERSITDAYNQASSTAIMTGDQYTTNELQRAMGVRGQLFGERGAMGQFDMGYRNMSLNERLAQLGASQQAAQFKRQSKMDQFNMLASILGLAGAPSAGGDMGSFWGPGAVDMGSAFNTQMQAQMANAQYGGDILGGLFGLGGQLGAAYLGK